MKTDIKGPEVQQLIKELVERRGAITSTLAIFETFTGNHFQLVFKNGVGYDAAKLIDSVAGSVG